MMPRERTLFMRRPPWPVNASIAALRSDQSMARVSADPSLDVSSSPSDYLTAQRGGGNDSCNFGPHTSSDDNGVIESAGEPPII
jgi:hypothetical protein